MNTTSKRHRGNKCHGKNIRNYQEQRRNDKKLTKEQKKNTLLASFCPLYH